VAGTAGRLAVRVAHLPEGLCVDLPPETTVAEPLLDVATALARASARTRDELESLVRIPSISADGHGPDACVRSAQRTAELLRDAGLQQVRFLEVDGAHPYVYGEWLGAGADAPTVLLYAHHDVQPVGTPDNWTSDPFTPTERDGRLYARGAADDKAGVMVHVAAVRAWLQTRGELPVNVKVIIEGEEEIASPHLPAFLAEHADTLASDVIVLTDLTNWKVGWPGLTYALRGMGELTVTLSALEQPVHSGMWGGPVPDALTGMVRLLATLHDDRGGIAVDGYLDDVRRPTPEERRRLEALGEDADEFRREVRMRDGVEFIGDPDATLWERVWMQPTITPIGIDAPDVRNAANTLLSTVRAKLSLRFAPGQDPAAGQRRLTEHLRAHTPWGLHADVVPGERNPAWVTEPDGPAWEAATAAMAAAYGREPANLGCGGSIPFVQPFSEAFGGAPCLLTGIEDPGTNAHGEDESLHLGDFVKACLTEALLFAELADRSGELATARTQRSGAHA
jgi:acetylornithine deacetylase/succinyl-diaminopimelate desuccinylase-like protein